MVRFPQLVMVFLVLASCVPHEDFVSEVCEGIDVGGYVSFGEDCGLRMNPDLALYYPECANEVLLANGMENVHVATFEERKAQFGAEWEEAFYSEACINRAWNGRRPTICIP
ncbi:MAG: hypothetical protein HDKAJFGB_04084 [Anaerolineae bacterium]|nr:hypothetical protein [Anaerolineae bacterium]